jgi:hypothetical protein
MKLAIISPRKLSARYFFIPLAILLSPPFGFLRIIDLLSLVAFGLFVVSLFYRKSIWGLESKLIILLLSFASVSQFIFGTYSIDSFTGYLGFCRSLLAFFLGTYCSFFKSNDLFRVFAAIFFLSTFFSILQYVGTPLNVFFNLFYPPQDPAFLLTIHPTTFFGLNTYNIVGLCVSGGLFIFYFRSNIFLVFLSALCVLFVSFACGVLSYGFSFLIVTLVFVFPRRFSNGALFSILFAVASFVCLNSLIIELDSSGDLKLKALQALITNPQHILDLPSLFPGLSVRFESTYFHALNLFLKSPLFGNGFGVAYDNFWLVSLASIGFLGTFTTGLILFHSFQISQFMPGSIGIHIVISILLFSTPFQLPFFGGLSSQLFWFLIGWQTSVYSRVNRNL